MFREVFYTPPGSADHSSDAGCRVRACASRAAPRHQRDTQQRRPQDVPTFALTRHAVAKRPGFPLRFRPAPKGLENDPPPGSAKLAGDHPNAVGQRPFWPTAGAFALVAWARWLGLQPSAAAVCSNVAPNSVGSSTDCAQRSASTLSASLTAALACVTNFVSTRRGLAM